MVVQEKEAPAARPNLSSKRPTVVVLTDPVKTYLTRAPFPPFGQQVKLHMRRSSQGQL